MMKIRARNQATPYLEVCLSPESGPLSPISRFPLYLETAVHNLTSHPVKSLAFHLEIPFSLLLVSHSDPCLPQRLLHHIPLPCLCYLEDFGTWALSTSHAPLCSCGTLSLHLLRQCHQKCQLPISNCINVLQGDMKWQHPPSPLHSPTLSPPPYSFEECCVWDLTGHTDFLLLKFTFHVLNYDIINSSFVPSSHIPKVSQGAKTN